MILKKIIEKIYLCFNDNLVYFDSVTKCKTRFYYDNVVKNKYRNKECCVVYIDINNLKQVNDNFGHYKGTELIKLIGKDLLELPDKYDVCRIGGDEFIVICPIDADLSEFKDVKGISYGFSFKEKYEDMSSAVRKADENMYIMKKSLKDKNE